LLLRRRNNPPLAPLKEVDLNGMGSMINHIVLSASAERARTVKKSK
jgi:hypothetical protein